MLLRSFAEVVCERVQVELIGILACEKRIILDLSNGWRKIKQILHKINENSPLRTVIAIFRIYLKNEKKNNIRNARYSRRDTTVTINNVMVSIL